MTTPSTPDDIARVEAQRELDAIRQQISEARAVLERILAEVEDAEGRLRLSAESPLLAVNQQLVLAYLSAQIAAESTARSTAAAAQSAMQAAQARYQTHHMQLSEANEHLVLAAIGAQELQSAAEAAHQRQTRLLGMVAHELRHPLAPIRNAAAILARIPEQPPILVRMQAVIEKQVTHMSRLVNDLLDATRVASGKLRIDHQRIDLVPVIEEAVQAFRPAMSLRLQRFTGPQLPSSLPLDGDRLRLTQVLGNLLDNASKYTPDGGEIRLSVAVVDETVVIGVTDSGIGITAEALPRVFDPFVQDLHATVFNGVGLGLGLTVVRELVEGHGGTVAASSEGPGRGSRFVVTLPLPAGEAQG